jgi:hypothetical protein
MSEISAPPFAERNAGASKAGPTPKRVRVIRHTRDAGLRRARGYPPA